MPNSSHKLMAKTFHLNKSNAYSLSKTLHLNNQMLIYNRGFSFVVGHVHQNYICQCVRHMSWSLESSGFSYHLSSAFCLSLSHVWSTSCHKSFPKHSSNSWTTCKKPSLCNTPLCKNLCHMCHIRKATSILQKHMSLVLHPKATSILQKPMSFVLYPNLCQFCKNLCHLCYIPSSLNFAKTFVICAISQAMSILQNLMTLVLYLTQCQFCKNICHLYCKTTSNFAKSYVDIRYVGQWNQQLPFQKVGCTPPIGIIHIRSCIRCESVTILCTPQCPRCYWENQFYWHCLG